MSVEQLSKVVLPPTDKEHLPTHGKWVEVENGLGLQFPDDYKALITAFGAGTYDQFLHVFSPFARNKYLNIIIQKDEILNSYNTFRQEFPEFASYPAFPQPGGLFPWGTTDNGDVLYWQVEENEDTSWAIVVFDGRHAEHERYDMTVTNFLTEVLTGALKVGIFPDDFPHTGPHTFVPVS